MPAPNPYIDFLQEQFSPLGDITSKSMFGGYCLYCDGTIFGLVADNALFLKADTENRESFTERGSRPFKPFPDRDEVMSYFEAPPEIFEDPDAMKKWVGSAIEAGRRGVRKNPARSAKKKKRSV